MLAELVSLCVHCGVWRPELRTPILTSLLEIMTRSVTKKTWLANMADSSEGLELCRVCLLGITELCVR